mmetsp:Transcript_22237/g.34999  ORF Transcript_22237/g.34999 Transcript_22237/m.34999 type:complete len:119 (-) Transcript_22237:1107-1463(-)|eukprot:909645-Amorphochlora_amoeboformis.AAC.2
MAADSVLVRKVYRRRPSVMIMPATTSTTGPTVQRLSQSEESVPMKDICLDSENDEESIERKVEKPGKAGDSISTTGCIWAKRIDAREKKVLLPNQNCSQIANATRTARSWVQMSGSAT